jgi:hypothetical protein
MKHSNMTKGGGGGSNSRQRGATPVAAATMEERVYKFRCLSLPEHLNFPYVRVMVLEYEWFVQLPPKIRPGQYFLFTVRPKDLEMAQTLRRQYPETDKPTTPGEAATNTAEMQTKLAELIQQLPAGTSREEQQKHVLRFLQPSLHVITDCEVDWGIRFSGVGQFPFSLLEEIYLHPLRCIIVHLAFSISFACGFALANNVRYHLR